MIFELLKKFFFNLVATSADNCRNKNLPANFLTNGTGTKNVQSSFSPKIASKLFYLVFDREHVKVEEKHASAPYIFKIRTFLEIIL